ncbi:MAG: alpha/beta fold hydrolase [Phycisphaeraceae bacterium]
MLGLLLLFLIAYLLIAFIGTAVIVFAIVRPRRKSYAFAVAHDLPLEPSDLELTGEEVTFNLPGNHTTPGWIITGNNPAGPTVLVLHGHRDFTHGAMRFVKTLAPFASHIVLFDWPGHGNCTAPWMTCGMREPNDALAVLDGLPDEMRDKPIVLFGYSLGGQIAVKTAALHPDRFAGLIIDGAYRRWDTPIRLKLKRYRVPAFPFIHLTGLAFGLTGLIRKFDRAHFAKQFTKPTLVIHGTNDRICPIHEGKELADAAPDSTFIEIQDGRHNQVHEQEPHLYRAALEQFFQTIPQ